MSINVYVHQKDYGSLPPGTTAHHNLSDWSLASLVGPHPGGKMMLSLPAMMAFHQDRLAAFEENLE